MFEVWKEYEGIAMHFNELLIQLRMRALGGIAVITALVSLLSKGDAETGFRWGVLAAVLAILALVWIAIWVIDLRYYRRLLYGAVRAVLEVEKLSESSSTVARIQMSHRIKETAEGGRHNPEPRKLLSDAVVWFYSIILVSLLVGVLISTDQHCTQLSKTSAEQSHGICRVLPDWNKPLETTRGNE